MTTFESNITKSECNDEEIFRILSDLNNIERIKDQLPQNKISDLEYDTDSCRFKVNPIGQLGLRIVERECAKLIKFEAEQSPIAFNLWIQLKQVEENDTRIKVTVKADLNPMIKMMVSKPLEDMVNKMADMLAKLPYRNL